MSTNNIRRRFSITSQGGRQYTQLSGDYSDCSTREMKMNCCEDIIIIIIIIIIRPRRSRYRRSGL